MKRKPLVSVTIPTYNSEKTLKDCLESIKNQTYAPIELIIVDSYSTDSTIDIAKRYGAKIIQTRYKLLGARYLGLKHSRGDLILLLDSDQILNKTAIARAVSLVEKGYDMLCFEEYSYNPQTWIQKLFNSDRKLVHKFATLHFNPLYGVLLARFYRREILEKAFRKIPQKLYPFVVAHDHAIIYYEAYNISKKVTILKDAVYHLEPKSLIQLWKKNFRYGLTTKYLLKAGFYTDLLKKKARFRLGFLSDFKLGIQSILLLALKGIPYKIGYWCG